MILKQPWVQAGRCAAASPRKQDFVAVGVTRAASEVSKNVTVNSRTEKPAPALFDPAAVRRIRADTAALESFYLAFYDDVVRYLTRRVGDPHDVADLVADTFVAAIDAAPSYDPRRGQVLPWLIGIAHNKLHRWYRQRGSDRDLARRVVGRRWLDADDIGQLEERIDAAALAPRPCR